MKTKKKEAKLQKLTEANTKMLSQTLKEAGALQGLVSNLEDTETLAIKLKHLDKIHSVASELGQTAKRLLRSLEKQGALEAKLSRNGKVEKTKPKDKSRGKRVKKSSAKS